MIPVFLWNIAVSIQESITIDCSELFDGGFQSLFFFKKNCRQHRLQAHAFCLAVFARFASAFISLCFMIAFFCISSYFYFIIIYFYFLLLSLYALWSLSSVSLTCCIPAYFISVCFISRYVISLCFVSLCLLDLGILYRFKLSSEEACDCLLVPIVCEQQSYILDGFIFLLSSPWGSLPRRLARGARGQAWQQGIIPRTSRTNKRLWCRWQPRLPSATWQQATTATRGAAARQVTDSNW